MRANAVRPYEKTGNVSIESVGAVCDRPLWANAGEPLQGGGGAVRDSGSQMTKKAMRNLPFFY